MSYVHSEKVIHRDMNLGNFLLGSDWTLKISDFGNTLRLTDDSNDKLDTTPGTAYFLSPEVCTGYYSYSCDVWSFGLIVAEICSLPDSIKIHSTPMNIAAEFDRLYSSCGVKDGKRVFLLLDSDSFSSTSLVEFLLKRETALGVIKKYSSSLEKICMPCLYFETDKIKVRPSFEDLEKQLVELQVSQQWNFKMPTLTLEEFLSFK